MIFRVIPRALWEFPRCQRDEMYSVRNVTAIFMHGFNVFLQTSQVSYGTEVFQ
jgi:hypothetical protein